MWESGGHVGEREPLGEREPCVGVGAIWGSRGHVGVWEPCGGEGVMWWSRSHVGERGYVSGRVWGESGVGGGLCGKIRGGRERGYAGSESHLEERQSVGGEWCGKQAVWEDTRVRGARLWNVV